MGLEVSVTKVDDLNSAWPLGTDLVNEGDNHVRNVKVAIKSLRDGTNGVRQLGLDTVEVVLGASPTNIDYTGLIQRGGRVAVIMTQDGTGGRTITWAAKFRLASTAINDGPGKTTVFEFVGSADGNLYLVAPPLLEA